MTIDLTFALSRPDALGVSGQLFQPKLIPRLHEALRFRRYSLKTEKAYVQWVRRYILFHGKRHPQEMDAVEVTAFLDHLANTRHVAAATQNQALAALLFLYREVLEIELSWLDNLVRAKTAKRLPTALTGNGVPTILSQLTGTPWLMVSILYGAGLRLNKCLSPRVKDVDLNGSKLFVREGRATRIG